MNRISDITGDSNKNNNNKECNLYIDKSFLHQDIYEDIHMNDYYYNNKSQYNEVKYLNEDKDLLQLYVYISKKILNQYKFHDILDQVVKMKVEPLVKEIEEMKQHLFDHFLYYFVL